MKSKDGMKDTSFDLGENTLKTCLVMDSLQVEGHITMSVCDTVVMAQFSQ